MLTAVKEVLTFAAEALGEISSFALVLVGWGIILCLVAKYLSNGIVPWIWNKFSQSTATLKREELFKTYPRQRDFEGNKRMNLLEIQGITKSFGGFMAVNG